LLVLALAAGPLWAGDRELQTVEAANGVAAALSGIPPALLRDARAVAVVPHVVKVGLLLDHRFGRGVLLVHRPDGCWSQPLFVTLQGNGIGLEAGVAASDVVLVFKSEHSLDRILKGKGHLKLGADAAVVAGPLGHETETSATLRRNAEVYAYSHSRGLFVGVSLEGDELRVDGGANEAFYHVHGGQATEVLALHEVPVVVEVEKLKGHFTRLCGPPAPAAIIVPPPHHLER
jgi:lipid-binding SYLF domain-containing protein